MLLGTDEQMQMYIDTYINTDVVRCKFVPPSEDDFNELNYLENNFDIYFEPSRRYHYYRIR